jgi:ankyrin repeat protein
LLWYYPIHQPPTKNDDLNSYILQEVAHRLERGCGFSEIMPLFINQTSLRFSNVAFCDFSLAIAAKSGCEVCIEYLIQVGGRQSIRFLSNTENGFIAETALQVAAEGGHLEAVSALIRAGAHISAAPAEESGLTALQAAAEAGHLRVVNTLIRENADVTAAPGIIHGKTALQAAAYGGHFVVTNALIQANADVNVPGGGFGYHRTALQAAAVNGHLEVVITLLEVNADVNLVPKDSYCKSPLKEAEAQGHLEVAELLRLAGAQK